MNFMQAWQDVLLHLSSSTSIAWMLIIFFIHLLLCMMFSLLMIYAIALPIIRRKGAFFIYATSLGTFIPLFGPLFVLIGLILLKNFSRSFHSLEVNIFPFIQYTRKNPIKSVAYAQNWAMIRLHSSQFSREERTKALASISKNSPQESNFIYSSLVSDDSEELRMCAFSMLERQQDFLQGKINQLLKRHASITDENKKAYLAKHIALLYWELVYRNLSDHEFCSILLEMSLFYAKSALKTLPKDGVLLILLARISIKSQHIEEGIEYLNMASKVNVSHSKINPYLAELAFKEKNYPLVKEYLCADPSFRYIFKLNKLIDFWCKHDPDAS